jgi:hypothetical protein
MRKITKRATNAERAEVALLLEILEQGYRKKAWHGPNLKQSLRGVSADDAAWRPAPGSHNIWEEALHAAYWKYVVRRRLSAEKRGSFARKGSNWFARPGTQDEKSWQHDRDLVEAEHRQLRSAVASLPAGKLNRRTASLIFGVAFHDIYHAGQIRLLRRLREGSRGG